ncbi:MAG: pyridoxamine 5'-phosphate oxidase [Balneolaceae bacterium]|nr:MAG: pyridoxamine 5'-phosphate oxidase [Balneolaceae bacterium]
MTPEIASLRRNYTDTGLPDNLLPGDPFLLFKRWFDEALSSGVLEPNAMTLATSDSNTLPNARTVLMKGINESSIRFFSNYESQKGAEIQHNSNVACVFWWGELERQVRLRGLAKKISEQESENYFKSRPRDSQIGAWASRQSSPIKNREELEKLFSEIRDSYNGRDIPKPPFWGGYDIEVHQIEFWAGRPGRLHDRILYEKRHQTWSRKRLMP